MITDCMIFSKQSELTFKQAKESSQTHQVSHMVGSYMYRCRIWQKK